MVELLDRPALASQSQEPDLSFMHKIVPAGALLLFLTAHAFPQVNVLTANYGNDRTSANTQETILTPSNVNSSSFGKLGVFPVDGQIYAQPLYVGGVPIANKGTHNVVYVATMHNSVYAIDADKYANTLPLWQVHLGAPVLASTLNFDDIDPEVGILSTPVIDLSRNVMYVVSDTLEQGAPVYKIHALDLSDGSEKLGGPVPIQATVDGTGDASQGGKISFDASAHLQRPGLLLLNGSVYVAFGSRGDIPPYHGWVIAYDASNLQNPPMVLNVSPHGSAGAVWQTGRGLAADSNGNIYLATSNGHYDGITDFSQTFLRLDNKLSIQDWFTPGDWRPLSVNDDDIGSQGPILVPGTNFLIGGGKAGTVYLVDRSNMGHLAGAPTEVFPAVNVAGINNMALWTKDAHTNVVYIQEQGSPLKAYQLIDGHFQSTLISKTTFPTGGYPYQGFTISSNGTQPGTAIVWENVGYQNRPGVPGTLYAFDASDLTHLLWSSQMLPERDVLGMFAKFANPTVVNGKVYVPTFAHELAIYGLLSGSNIHPTQIAAVTNGASYVGGPVSPGELVAIFGTGLGPGTLAVGQFDSSGRLTKELAGTVVTFNGISAPLLYTSATQVGALVPFSVPSFGTVTVKVSYAGSSATYKTAAATSTPAIFSLDSSGAGQGVILNQDGTVNSPQHPAKIGSTIVFYATGLGNTAPAADDGDVASTDPNATLPAPVQKVSVVISGTNAKVSYAGAAPGFLTGIFQINAVIPPNVFTDDEIPIVIEVGGQTSQAALSVALTK